MAIGIGSNSTERFTGRAEYYMKYRPGYPQEVIGLLKLKIYLNQSRIIADIGSGTGIFSEMFLKNGNTVYCVEPNQEMRQTAEKVLAKYTGFKSVDGTAENTGLPDNSVDIVTAAQAFHWFDIKKARNEFMRILKPGGQAVLIWNKRKEDATIFMEEYEDLNKRFGLDYKSVGSKKIDDYDIEDFFGHRNYEKRVLLNSQKLDLEGFKGRVQSTSYMPLEGSPKYSEVMAEAEYLYERYKNDREVTLEYETCVYFGKLL